MARGANKRRNWLAVERYQTGIWAYLLHRLSGLLLVGYLFVHIAVISSSTTPNGQVDFNRVLGFFERPLFVALDILLIGVVLYHAANGLRVILFDMGLFIRQQKSLFWTMMGLAAGVWVYALWRLLPLVTAS